jgi:hypothetical protein
MAKKSHLCEICVLDSGFGTSRKLQRYVVLRTAGDARQAVNLAKVAKTLNPMCWIQHLQHPATMIRRMK